MISLTNSTIQTIYNLTNGQNIICYDYENKSKIDGNYQQTFLQKKRNLQANSLFNSSYNTLKEESTFYIKNTNEINKKCIEQKVKNEENNINDLKQKSDSNNNNQFNIGLSDFNIKKCKKFVKLL